MKQIKVQGHQLENGQFDAKTATVVTDNSDITTDDWNTLINVLRLRKREGVVRPIQNNGFVYSFPFNLS